MNGLEIVTLDKLNTSLIVKAIIQGYETAFS